MHTPYRRNTSESRSTKRVRKLFIAKSKTCAAGLEELACLGISAASSPVFDGYDLEYGFSGLDYYSPSLYDGFQFSNSLSACVY